MRQPGKNGGAGINATTYTFNILNTLTSLVYVKGCSHGATATAIYISLLMGCMRFGFVVAIALCKHVN